MCSAGKATQPERWRRGPVEGGNPTPNHASHSLPNLSRRHILISSKLETCEGRIWLGITLKMGVSATPG